MKTIIITDTHFGTRNNSKVWCDYQIKFIDNTLLPLVKKLSQKDAVRVIHCGDLFDSKSTLNDFLKKLPYEEDSLYILKLKGL